jgi:hypothetical protein
MLLLAAADRKLGLIDAMSAGIRDRRQASKVSHDMPTLVRERVLAIAAGYEDANDLDSLRADPALKLACSRAPETDAHLASQPTLSRLENAASKTDLMRMALALAEQVVAQLPADTKRLLLDLDEMEDPCHGQQEFEFFNAHYNSHCYLPLLLFVTDGTGKQRLMTVLLREGKSGCRGVSGLLTRAVAIIRARFPEIDIELRADAGYGNDEVLRCCDALKIEYTIGLPSNNVLHRLSRTIQMDAYIKYAETKDQPDHGAIREFGTINYKAGPWDKARSVIVKAEITKAASRIAKLNPRFVVTNRQFSDAEAGYTHYCGRGDAENRIKEFNLDLSGGRTSCHSFQANQFRVLLHAAASVLMSVLQDAAQSTSWAKAQMRTLRLRLVKIGARITETVRRVWIHMSSSFPDQSAWHTIYAALTG